MERTIRVGYGRSVRDIANNPTGLVGRLLMWTIFWTLLIYWLAAFVGCFVVVEMAQDQLYDEVTPKAGLKVSAGALLLAAAMTYSHPSFETMFTSNILTTVLQGIVWFGVFTLILQFHPWHALGLSMLTMVLISPLATMGVDSILKPTPQAARTSAGPVNNKPVRQSLTPPAPATAPAEETPLSKD